MRELLSRLEKSFGRFAIPHLTLYIVAGQALVFIYGLLERTDEFGADIISRMQLVPLLVSHGELWRLVTFIFIPPGTSYLWIAFVLYFLYFMGTAMESHWGTFRYNLFILSGWALTVAVAFFTPGYTATNVFIGGSIFLAFAYLYPDFIIYIFFILPVKIRWIAIVTWLGYGWAFFTAGSMSRGLSTRLAILAAVGNYILFFGRDIVLDIRQGRRRMKSQIRRAASDAGQDEPRFRCLACGRDSTKNPQLDFRYCSQCAGECCYCTDHIRNHVHVVADGKS